MKRYFLLSLIIIALIGLFVFIQDNSVTTFNIAGIDLSLPNALWVVIFLAIYLIFSLIFIAFNNLKNTLYQKNVKKDIQTIVSNIKNQVLYKNDFKDTKVLKSINNFVKNIKGLSIIPEGSEEFEFLEDLKRIQNGEVIEISKYRLSNENPWFIQNIKNRLRKDPNYAKDVLKKFKNEELKKEAFYIFAKKAEIKEILKYEYPINLEIVISHVEDKELQSLLERAKLTPSEEIEVAKKIYQTKDPDSELETIKPLKWGSAYLALKYEHIDLAKSIVEENSLKFFEYFIKLKEAGIKAEIDEYLNSKI